MLLASCGRCAERVPLACGAAGAAEQVRMRAPGRHWPGCAALHCSGIAGAPCSIMQTEGLGSSPQWLSSATESSEVSTPLLRQCARRWQRPTRQQRRSEVCPRLEALLAVVQQSLKANGAERRSSGMATRSMRRSAPAAQPAPAGAAGTPGSSIPCGADQAARCAVGPAWLLNLPFYQCCTSCDAPMQWGRVPPHQCLCAH